MRHAILTCFAVLLIGLTGAESLPAAEQQLSAAPVQSAATPSSQTFSPVSALKNYYVDPYTGTANFTIPLVIPPPRPSLPFSLNLVYSSRAGNGWLGVGWKLNLGVVERSTKNGYPTYTAADQFVFSLGEQQNDLVAIGGQEYRPKTADAAWRFRFDGTVWTANDPRGNTYTFGLEQQLGDLSRTKDPANPAHVFRWRLSKISDPLGIATSPTASRSPIPKKPNPPKVPFAKRTITISSAFSLPACAKTYSPVLVPASTTIIHWMGRDGWKRSASAIATN